MARSVYEDNRAFCTIVSFRGRQTKATCHSKSQFRCGRQHTLHGCSVGRSVCPGFSSGGELQLEWGNTRGDDDEVRFDSMSFVIIVRTASWRVGTVALLLVSLSHKGQERGSKRYDACSPTNGLAEQEQC